jgi:Transferrin
MTGGTLRCFVTQNRSLLASIAFINIAKGRGMFKREECEFGQLLAGFFADSCMPGSRNPFYDPSTTNPDKLCMLCRVEPPTTTQPLLRPMADRVDSQEEAIEGSDNEDVNVVRFIPMSSIDCAASPSNRFYGTRGALTCLSETGEVAVIEHQNLALHAAALKLNPTDFRILCRNGSLAANAGFDVDPECFLTTIVDGEVVIRRKSDKNLGVVGALLSLDKYLQNEPDFKMYNIFAGDKNLLFEDSSIGLVSPDDGNLSPSVKNYIRLFEDVENCIEEKGGSQSIAGNIALTFSLVLFAVLIRN